MVADHVVVNVAWGQPEQLSGVSEQCSHIPGVTLLILTFVSVSWAHKGGNIFNFLNLVQN